MVFNYVQKTDKGSRWTEESMAKTMKSIKEDKMAIREATVKFDILYSTLRKHCIKGSAAKVILSRIKLTKHMKVVVLIYRRIICVFYSHLGVLNKFSPLNKRSCW